MTDISLWLVPEKEQRDSLQTIINSLANKYHAFPFIPHITAYHWGTSTKLSTVISISQEIAQRTKPLVLNLDTISYSTQFTKTLFAKYHISPEFQVLYDEFHNKFYSIYPYDLNPHLSLIYKNNMNEENKKKEIERLHIPQQLTLDRIMIITREGSDITQEKDVTDWNVALDLLLH
jgi:hypothetical protein